MTSLTAPAVPEAPATKEVADLARETSLEPPSVEAARAGQLAQLDRHREKPPSRTRSIPITTTSVTTIPTPDATVWTSGPLTAGQVEFLQEVDRAGLRVQFDSISPSKRDQFLAPHARGFDPTFLRMAAVDLRRVKAPPPDLPPPTSLAEMVGRLGDGDASLAGAVAEMLCRDFGTRKDRDLWVAFHNLAADVLRGDIDGAIILDAHRQAMGPQSRNRGAVFVTALRRHGWSS